MIDIKLIYELHTKEINLKINKALELQVKYQEYRTNLKNILTPYSDSIRKYSKTTLDKILKTTSLETINLLTFPSYPVYSDGKEIPFKAILMYVEKYIKYNKLLSVTTGRVSSYKKELISYKTYKTIVSLFNDKMIEEVITNNYSFEPLPSFGCVDVIRNYNKRDRVNWGASDKSRAKLLAEGKVPYLKAEAEEAERKGIPYEGVKWLVYHPHLDFYLQWHTKWISKKVNPYLSDYTYTPARGVRSIVSRLQEVKRNRELALSLYTRTLNS